MRQPVLGSFFHASAVPGSNGTPLTATAAQRMRCGVMVSVSFGDTVIRNVCFCSLMVFGLPRLGNFPGWWSGMPLETMVRTPSCSVMLTLLASAGFAPPAVGVLSPGFAAGVACVGAVAGAVAGVVGGADGLAAAMQPASRIRLIGAPALAAG